MPAAEAWHTPVHCKMQQKSRGTVPNQGPWEGEAEEEVRMTAGCELHTVRLCMRQCWSCSSWLMPQYFVPWELRLLRPGSPPTAHSSPRCLGLRALD
jgi:hypothetical protein